MFFITAIEYNLADCVLVGVSGRVIGQAMYCMIFFPEEKRRLLAGRKQSNTL